ncbi:SAM-dependent methyltransferase [Halobacillus halophilus]|uniref:Methyltransferase n=1 Tax=Halobacillus halophilus (strain ATCC 35676 / DSM 2266 / JCM 20832 / KCTC 3685 / LMG 17431 / NBRC 102448 / NCIMB 2269) TaxID=866895 RepID=I0JIS3_HALH3|nr:class I SAM-dependent methyltransferase [Halobacillus halophilus]ASF38213.1 SAM-dependent methyltransferase [Halobacillus halophilus]CCG44041.1 putative methyltransferase [Halobacillus halophilus DSM 2266]
MSKEMWDQRFSEPNYAYGKQPNAFIKDMSERLPKDSKIGCFAEGEGRNGVYLAKRGHDVTVLDQSDQGLNKAKQLAKEEDVSIETIQGDLTKMEMEPEQFDAAIMVFGHVPKPDQSFLMEQMIRSVKPGGHILFEVYSENQLAYGTGGPKSTEMLYAAEDVLSWIKDYKCLHFYYGEAERNEGERHNGVGHVIQGLIQK